MNKNTPPRSLRIDKVIEILIGLYYMRRRPLTHNQKRTIRQIAGEHGIEGQDPTMLRDIRPAEFTARNVESLCKIVSEYGIDFNCEEKPSSVIVLAPKLKKSNGKWEKRNKLRAPGRPRNKMLQERISVGGQNVRK